MPGHRLSATTARATNKLIHNDQRPMNWCVTVYAAKKAVNSFQCRTPEAALAVVKLIKADRALSNLPTMRATREQLLSGKGRNRVFGPVVEIDLN